jgi:hypothetical protein
MAPINPSKLRPSDLIRILNSAGQGEVLTEAVLRRQRMKAGFAIGDQRTINLLKYAGWLTAQYLKPDKPTKDYDAIKEAARQRSAEKARVGRDIGDIPAVVNLARKAAALASFKQFCHSYFSDIFYLPFSRDHETVIEKIEQAVLHGGLFALAMPRGSGKTSLMQLACVWAALSGNTDFVCLIAASGDRAKNLLENIKVWFETNPLLYEDFPEVVHPIRGLEGIVNRQKGQLYHGRLTRIEWAADKLVLPTIEGSQASGVVISCAGLKGSDIRGQNHARTDGKVVRPSLVMIDDPQTTESAWSASQSHRREAILAGDVLGMAGPGKKISGLMACTVIRPEDMADKILDRQAHPDWKGERTKMVYAFPTHEKFWAEYAEIRADSLRNDGDGSQATEFYRQHRQEMDAGAVIAWPERYNRDELSAIQHAMNLKLRDEAAFFAEYQNEPILESEGDEMLSVEEIGEKLNGYPKGAIPLGCNYLTMFIDVQQKALFYLIAAWEENFTGYVIDYGTWPDQKRHHFTLRDMRRTLQQAKPQAGLEGAIYHAMERLCAEKLGRAYRREDGLDVEIDRCLIDANWGQSTDVVYQFCRQSEYSRILLPSHGKYVGASSIPFSEYKRKKGDRVGHHWRIPNTTGKRAVRHVLVDTNYWKSFIQTRLAVAMGDPGCLSLYGRDEKRHHCLAEHLTAEYRIKTLARGREVDEWKLRANRPDNHWLDCLVGTGVAASIQGASLLGTETVRKQTQKIKLSDLQRKRLR